MVRLSNDGTLLVSEQCRDTDGRRMLAGLLAASHLMPLELLPAKTASHAAVVGFGQVLIYLADLQRDVLRLMTGEGLDAGQGVVGEEDELKIDGTVAGRAFQHGQILPGAPAGQEGSHWWVPLLDGAERLGVLRITTAGDDVRTREGMNLLAAVVALIVDSKRRSSDSHARLTRTQSLNIAAEMQWRLMPPRTCADGRLVIAAAMEPAYAISGDAYDYATAGHVVHLSIFDAMGHDTAAGLTAHLAMGACRNSRRQGAGPRRDHREDRGGVDRAVRQAALRHRHPRRPRHPHRCAHLGKPGPPAPDVVPRPVVAPVPAGPQSLRFHPVAARDAANQRRGRLPG